MLSLPPRILLLESDDDLMIDLARRLSHDGYRPVLCEGGHAGIALATREPFDVILVNGEPPHPECHSIITGLRDAGVSTPALVLIRSGKVQDRIAVLEAGADDCLVKPFAADELLARIRALLRRRVSAGPSRHLAAAGLKMDIIARTLERDGHTIELQAREFQLLEELVRNAGTFVTRMMLVHRVWRLNFMPRTNIVETQMSRLRAKLNAVGPDLIETSRGVGYRIRLD